MAIVEAIKTPRKTTGRIVVIVVGVAVSIKSIYAEVRWAHLNLAQFLVNWIYIYSNPPPPPSRRTIQPATPHVIHIFRIHSSTLVMSYVLNAILEPTHGLNVCE